MSFILHVPVGLITFFFFVLRVDLIPWLRVVVKLFNAIRTQQKITEEAVTTATSKSKTSLAIEKAKSGVCDVDIFSYLS